MIRYGTDLQRRGIHLGLVPTMGNLHEGHLSLVRLLDGHCDVKAASIFVNPIQFGPGEDLDQYPRSEKHDLELLQEEGCKMVFCPDAEDMYPSGYQTYVEVESLSKPLCGRYRPDHFRGVATVVLRLFNLTRCAVAAFGLKDYQQAQVIRKMTEDLHLPVELLFGEIVREPAEPDQLYGLALSSRNRYLSPEEHRLARLIPQSLQSAVQAAFNGEKNSARLIDETKRTLSSEPEIEIQYVEIVHPETLEPVKTVDGRAQLLLAVYVGSTRLIDNVELKC